MKLPGKLFKQQPSSRHLLVVQLKAAGARLAYFHDDQGELLFGGNAAATSAEEAYALLPNKPAHITDVVVGLPFRSLIDASTVVRYRRSAPQTKISEDEVKNALEQIPPLAGEEIFFEDLFNAKVDGLTTLEPVERMGEVIELNYYQASAPKSLLGGAREHVKKLGGEPGIVPSAYAIAKLSAQSAPKGALTLEIDQHSTEISLTSEGHLVGIKSFDIGGDQKEFFLAALEAATEELGHTELWPESVYLCGSATNLEEIRSEMLAYPWTKKVNMMNFPKIEVLHPLSVNLSLPADVGLNALSLLG